METPHVETIIVEVCFDEKDVKMHFEGLGSTQLEEDAWELARLLRRSYPEAKNLARWLYGFNDLKYVCGKEHEILPVIEADEN